MMKVLNVKLKGKCPTGRPRSSKETAKGFWENRDTRSGLVVKGATERGDVSGRREEVIGTVTTYFKILS
jgi:hypothetical protein